MDYNISDIKQKYTKYMSLSQKNPSNEVYRYKANKYFHYLEQVGGTIPLERYNTTDLEGLATRINNRASAELKFYKKITQSITDLKNNNATLISNERKAVEQVNEATERINILEREAQAAVTAAATAAATAADRIADLERNLGATNGRMKIILDALTELEQQMDTGEAVLATQRRDLETLLERGGG
jgi:DNA repair exonuclease SbcCD ATPase subunit